MKRAKVTATGRVLAQMRRFGVWGRIEPTPRHRTRALAGEAEPRLRPAPVKVMVDVEQARRFLLGR